MRRMLTTLLTMASLLPLVLGAALMSAGPAAAATLTRVTDFGANPTNLGMHVYVPDNVAPRPALLVLVHYCGGSADAIFNGTGRDFATAADRYGCVVVVPEATREGHCFDVSTRAGLTRNGGSDSTGIMSVVGWARQRYDVDPARIVVSGFSGVPAECFATTNGSLWNSQCSSGNIVKTPQEWGNMARSTYPGYTGSHPRMQLWHGDQDTTPAYRNFGEEIKQWTNLRGLSQTPSFTDRPQSSWTRTRYGDTGTRATVEGISITGTGHTLPQAGMLAYAIAFLGLDGGGGGGGGDTGPLRSVGAGKCLDVPNQSTTPGALVIIWTCHGGTNQKWRLNTDGSITGVQSGLCLEVTGASARLWTCNGQNNQKWNRV